MLPSNTLQASALLTCCCCLLWCVLLVPAAAQLLQLLAAVELELVHVQRCCLSHLAAVRCAARCTPLLGRLSCRQQQHVEWPSSESESWHDAQGRMRVKRLLSPGYAAALQADARRWRWRLALLLCPDTHGSPAEFVAAHAQLVGSCKLLLISS